MIDGGLDPQAALDAPRFCLDGIDSSLGAASVALATVLLEEGIEPAAAEQLRALGHNIKWPVTGEARAIFGRGQVIVRDKRSGVLTGGSDGRADGCCAGW
jgi:gamma-glutamyltranspeptidase/glutathione hydrolase